LGRQGASAIGKALAITKSLKELNVSHNSLCDESGELISMGLGKNSSLQQLQI
jgi:hypothetical protein